MKRPGYGTILRTVIGCGTLAILVVIAGYVIKKQFPGSGHYTLSKRIEYGFTIQNQTNSPIPDAEFRSFAPLDRTPVQQCAKIEASHPYEMTGDELGNRVLCFRLKELPPYGARVIRIGADLLMSDTPRPASKKNLHAFLKAEKYCESTHPEILALAHELQDSDTVRTAEKIFNWVSTRVAYTGYVRNPRGALYALKEKKGDCTEFMYLFAALCRANRIPARCVGGYVVPESAILKPAGYHNWAEFFDGRTWQMADPQNKIFMDTPSRYVALHLIGETSDPSRAVGKQLFSFKGEGIQVEMNQ